MKTLTFHSDMQGITVFVNGLPVCLHGEVDVTIKEPIKKSRTNSIGWAAVQKDAVVAVSVETVPIV